MADSSVVVTFEGGLDMVTPVQNSAPGTLVDCLNYEVGPIKGYRRIDGYERYDGWVDGGVSNIYIFRGRALNPNFVYNVGDLLLRYGEVLGEVRSVTPVPDSNLVDIVYVPYLPTNILSVGVVGYRIRNPVTFVETGLLVDTSATDLRDSAASAEDYTTELRAAQHALRENVLPAPRPIAGVFYGRDRTYFALDNVTLMMAQASQTLSEGEFVALGDRGYVVARVEGWNAELLHVGYTPPVGDDLYKVSARQAYGADPSLTGATLITGWDFEASPSQTAQIYYTQENGPFSRGYYPCAPVVQIEFENGDTEFPSQVELSDGSAYWALELVDFYVSEGSFTNGDAKGVLFLLPTNATSGGFDGLWSGPVVVRTPGTGGADIADVTAMGFPILAGTGALQDTANNNDQCFYQWGVYNFLATRGREMTFCVNGVTRGAFVSKDRFNNPIYGNIIANPEADKDNPRYLSFHAGNRLALGFASGSVQLSAVGSPLNFSGLDGALELGNGDGITGLLEAQGDSTIVFGPRSIRRLVGAGADIALQTISSDSGAMDYTAVVVAGVPLYVNHNGLCALEQTSAYGDFKNSAISGPVDPFFTPRIIQDAYTSERGGTVCAFPVRAKNQYRLFLGDGSVLSVSLTTEGAQCMLSSYNTPSGQVRVPVAYGSSVGDNGREYLLCVWDTTKAAMSNGDPLPPDNQAYRLDHGWGFDGETFEHFIDTSYMFNENPNFLTIDKCALYGMGYGESSLRLMAFNVEDDFEQPAEVTRQDISMPRNPRIYTKTLTRFLGEVDHANWGRAVRLRFANIKDAGLTSVEPPHILQSVRLFVQTDGITE